MFMDSGYGSRLSAVSELARDMALRRLFGNGGPGKRSSHDMVNQRQQLPHLFREFTKRDHGYGSRVRAGHNMVNSLHARKNLFGAYGPGRKRNNVDFNDNFLADQLDTVPLDANFDTKTRESEISNHNADLPADYIRLRGSGFVRALANPLQSYEPQSSSNDLTLSLDEGYKSRIEAADQLAHDIETQEKIFGPLGPGRK